MTGKTVILFVLALIAGAVVITTVFRSPPKADALRQQPATVGNEQPSEGCVFGNGFNVCNYGEANLKDVYLQLRGYLGLPLGSFDSWSQVFEFGKLSYNAGNSPGWKVELTNLGAVDYQARGFTPQPGSDPHPALRDWLISQLEAGLDTTRVVGRVISPPVTDKATGITRQWTDKQAFEFPSDATSGSQVRRLQLGSSIMHASLPTAPTESKGSEQSSLMANLPVLIVVGIVGLMVLAWLAIKSGGGEVRPTG